MPSHIFTRLGLWDDSIESNLASAAAAQRHVAQDASRRAASFDELHALDYLVYAYLQEGQDAKAQRDGGGGRGRHAGSTWTQFAAATRWPRAGALRARAAAVGGGRGARGAPAWFPWDKFPYAEAITYFARAMGSARSGDTAAARKEIEKLAFHPEGAGACRRGTTTGKRR